MKKKRLIWQIYPSYILIVFVSLLAVGWYSINSIKVTFFEEAGEDLIARTHILKKQMKPVIIDYIQTDNRTGLNDYLEEIAFMSSTRLTVVTPFGMVIADSRVDPMAMENQIHQPEIKTALLRRTETSIRFNPQTRQRRIYTAIPLLSGNEIVAVIQSSVDVNRIDKALLSLQLRITIVGAIIAVLAALVSLLVSRRISRPIDSLKKGAQNYAQGKLGHLMPIPRSLELAELAEAMNHMAVQLNERINTVLRQRNELKAVLSSMKEGVLAIDNEERIISINDAAAQMFGKNPENLVGLSVHEMVRNPELHRFLHSALSGKEPESQDIFLYHYEDRVINIHSSTLFDAAGKPIGILSVLNDVTRLRRLENIRRDFAANVSHELKTPLTAIAGFVETLRNGAFAQPEKAQQFFAIIEKHVERLSAIIDDLMELSKIEQKVKNRQIELSENEIENLVWSAREICLVKAAEKNIDVQINCQNGLNATINPQLLEQAVVNLLDNAIKYSPPGSQVLVTAEQLDSFAVIRIQDKGPGIEKKHLSRIFERFYRVDKARSRKIGGTGLGLAIVKHIAQAHNGTVEVESTPGKGSVFSIQLPPKSPK